MTASDVYYMDARSESPQTGLVAKMLTVFEAAGLDQLITPGDLVAIKIHCGEWNNTAYLRPVYPRALADRVKDLGGRPYVCDTTTLTYHDQAAVVLYDRTVRNHMARRLDPGRECVAGPVVFRRAGVRHGQQGDADRVEGSGIINP